MTILSWDRKDNKKQESTKTPKEIQDEELDRIKAEKEALLPDLDTITFTPEQIQRFKTEGM